MKLSNYLFPAQCLMRLSSSTRDGAVAELAGALAASGKVSDLQELIRSILQREQLGSTGIGNGVAIPHAPTTAVSCPVIAYGRSEQGIDFGALDGQTVRHIFLIGTAPQDLNVYLRLLSQLSRLLNDRLFLEECSQAVCPEEIREVIEKYEKIAVEVTR